MDFTTYIFWVIAISGISIIYIISYLLRANDKLRQTSIKIALCFLSLSLLYTASITTLLIFALVTMAAYTGCFFGQNLTALSKKILLGCLIILLLLPLLYYKYANFALNNVAGYQFDTLKDLVIPIGISFYTFQIIAFCIDTLKNNHQIPRFIDFLNFCSFFPQIVAGPIERRASLLPQMQNLTWKFSADSYSKGIPYIILGLYFKLVMADNLSVGMITAYAGENAFQIWVNNILFSFRIYYDFAGYGLTAYGIAKCLGVNLMMNFMSPYTCCNVSDFWRKWHISLTLWFRDYIYFSLGGSRTKFWMFNILIMFLVSGIWHGAGWNFIIWGGLAGITMIIHRYFSKTHIPIPSFISWGLTFGVMVFIWMFFYETNMDIVMKNVRVVFTPSCYNISEFIELVQDTAYSSATWIVFIPIAFIMITFEYLSRKKHEDPYKIFLNPRACSILLILICILHCEKASEFIYFAF